MQLAGVPERILSTIERNIDVLAGTFGFIADPLAQGLDKAIPFAIDRIKKWLPGIMKDPMFPLTFALENPNYYISQGAIAALAGWIMEQVTGDIHPVLPRLGSLLKKGGVAIAIGSLIGAYTWLPGLKAEGSSSSSSSSGLTGFVYK